MEDFDDIDDYESPLDLDGDGDDAMEMCLFFDDDNKKKGSKPPGSSGCCIFFLAVGSSLVGVIYGISYLIT